MAMGNGILIRDAINCGDLAYNIGKTVSHSEGNRFVYIVHTQKKGTASISD